MADEGKKAQRITQFEVKLPECSYSSTLLVVHGFIGDIRKGKLGACDAAVFFCFVLIPEVIIYALNIAVQVGITYFISLEVPKIEICQVNVSPVLQWIGVATFVGEMIQDMIETSMIASWLVGTNEVTGDVEDWEPDAMLKRDKVALIIFIVLPKFGIAFWLTSIGSTFVALSENNAELILNCVAVVFVTKLDELAHATVSSQYVKKCVKAVKPLQVESEVAAMCDIIFGPLVKSGLWAGIVSLAIYSVPEC